MFNGTLYVKHIWLVSQVKFIWKYRISSVLTIRGCVIQIMCEWNLHVYMYMVSVCDVSFFRILSWFNYRTKWKSRLDILLSKLMMLAFVVVAELGITHMSNYWWLNCVDNFEKIIPFPAFGVLRLAQESFLFKVKYQNRGYMEYQWYKQGVREHLMIKWCMFPLIKTLNVRGRVIAV